MLTAKIIERLLPAERVHEHDGKRRVEELPERACGRAKAEGERAPLRRQQLAERRQNDHERGAGKAESDQHAGGNVEHRGAGRMRHQREAGGIHQPADAEHPTGAEAVGDDAGERLADAPKQVLQRQRKGEYVAAPVIGGRHRGEEKAERGTRAEGHQRDQAAETDDQHWRAPSAARGAGLRRVEPIIDTGHLRLGSGVGFEK